MNLKNAIHTLHDEMEIASKTFEALGVENDASVMNAQIGFSEYWDNLSQGTQREYISAFPELKNLLTVLQIKLKPEESLHQQDRFQCLEALIHGSIYISNTILEKYKDNELFTLSSSAGPRL